MNTQHSLAESMHARELCALLVCVKVPLSSRVIRPSDAETRQSYSYPFVFCMIDYVFCVILFAGVCVCGCVLCVAFMLLVSLSHFHFRTR
jgi:hypothetical protein